MPDAADADLRELIERARRAQENAYAPYSAFRVGAAVRTGSARIFGGCNVENASYGATLCAERVALAAMVAEGARDPQAIAIYTDTDPPSMPCGLCRQALAEFGASELVVVAAGPERSRQTTLGELLPERFVLVP